MSYYSCYVTSHFCQVSIPISSCISSTKDSMCYTTELQDASEDSSHDCFWGLLQALPFPNLLLLENIHFSYSNNWLLWTTYIHVMEFSIWTPFTQIWQNLLFALKLSLRMKNMMYSINAGFSNLIFFRVLIGGTSNLLPTNYARAEKNANSVESVKNYKQNTQNHSCFINNRWSTTRAL